MSSQTKLIIAVVAILGVVGIAAAGLFILQGINNASNPAGSDTNTATGSDNDSDQNDSSDDFTSEDHAQCVSGCQVLYTGDGSAINSCISACDAAEDFASDDVADCDNQEDAFRDSCIIDKAVEQQNPDFCTRVESSIFVISCYSAVADEMQDASVCQNIDEGIYRTACLENLE